MKKLMSLILVLAVLIAGAALAETSVPYSELHYVEKVIYWGDGVFEIEFMRNVPWRTDYVLTAVDDEDLPLVVSALGGDANEAYVRIDGDLRPDALYSISFVTATGMIPAVGQATVGFSYANYCEYCLTFGHDEMACTDRKAAGITYEVDRCDLCGELGHEDDFCPDRQMGVEYCDECGNTGHDDDFCPYDDDDDDQYGRCDQCGQQGHDDDRCPVYAAGYTQPTQAAQSASAAVTASVQRTPRPEYCDDCREYGHDDDECPNERCDECGEYGHDDDDCPNERCDECGRYGHDDDDCPNERCDECGKYGHDDDDCPNERCDECGKYGHDDDDCPYDRDDDDD